MCDGPVMSGVAIRSVFRRGFWAKGSSGHVLCCLTSLWFGLDKNGLGDGEGGVSLKLVEGSALVHWRFPELTLPNRRQVPSVGGHSLAADHLFRQPKSKPQRCVWPLAPVQGNALVVVPMQPFLKPFPSPRASSPLPPQVVLSGGVKWRCGPQGPVPSEGTKAQRAHRELRSLECSWGREGPEGLPSTGTPPAGLHSRRNTTREPLGQSRSAPDRSPSGVQSWAGGSRRSPDPQTPPSGLVAGQPLPGCWGPEHWAHTTPPPPPAHRRTTAPLEKKGVPLCLTL